MVIRAGVWLFVAGVLFTLVALVPLAVPDYEPSSAWWFLSMLTGVGLGLILLGLWRSARNRRRQVSQALTQR